MTLIDDFNAEGIDRKEITRDWYAARLGRFFQWLDNGQDRPEEDLLKQISPQVVKRFLASLRDFSWSTRNGTYTALNAFFKWCELRGHIERNPFEQETIKRPRKPRQIQRPISLASVQTVLNVMNLTAEEKMTKRDRALLLVLLDAGLRRMEAIALNIGHVDLQTGAVAVLTGKGDNQRWSQIEPLTISAVRAWLAVHPVTQGARAPLFTTLAGKRLSDRRVNGILRRWSDAAGLEPHITPHGLRRLFASHFSHAGGGSKVLQAILGHENLSTTEGYILNTEDEIRRQHRLFSPVGKLRL